MRKFTSFGLLAAVSSLLLVGIAGAAGAEGPDDPYVGPTPSIAPETTVLVPEAPDDVVSEQIVSNEDSGEAQAAPVAEVRGESLAFTGGDATALALIGLVLVGGGALALAARRRTATPG